MENNNEHFKQQVFFCDELVQKHEVKKAKKGWNGMVETTIEHAKFELVQNQAISILDSETGTIEIRCPKMKNGKCDYNYERKPCGYAKKQQKTVLIKNLENYEKV